MFILSYYHKEGIEDRVFLILQENGGSNVSHVHSFPTYTTVSISIYLSLYIYIYPLCLPGRPIYQFLPPYCKKPANLLTGQVIIQTNNLSYASAKDQQPVTSGTQFIIAFFWQDGVGNTNENYYMDRPLAEAKHPVNSEKHLTKNQDGVIPNFDFLNTPFL